MNKVKVVVIHCAFESEAEAGSVGSFSLPCEVKAGCEDDLLELAYHKSQNLSENGWLNDAVEAGIFVVEEEKVKVINGHRSLRSSSVNDVFVVDFGNGDVAYFKVDFAGFEEMSEFAYKKHMEKLAAYRAGRG